jgi:hypothetical protein
MAPITSTKPPTLFQQPANFVGPPTQNQAVTTDIMENGRHAVRTFMFDNNTGTMKVYTRFDGENTTSMVKLSNADVGRLDNNFTSWNSAKFESLVESGTGSVARTELNSPTLQDANGNYISNLSSNNFPGTVTASNAGFLIPGPFISQPELTLPEPTSLGLAPLTADFGPTLVGEPRLSEPSSIRDTPPAELDWETILGDQYLREQEAARRQEQEDNHPDLEMLAEMNATSETAEETRRRVQEETHPDLEMLSEFETQTPDNSIEIDDSDFEDFDDSDFDDFDDSDFDDFDDSGFDDFDD